MYLYVYGARPSEAGWTAGMRDRWGLGRKVVWQSAVQARLPLSPSASGPAIPASSFLFLPALLLPSGLLTPQPADVVADRGGTEGLPSAGGGEGLKERPEGGGTR